MLSYNQAQLHAAKASCNAASRVPVPFKAFGPATARPRRAQLVCRTSGGVTASAAAVDTAAAITDLAETATGMSSHEETRALVDQVLAEIEGTDSGMSLSPDKRARVDDLLERLEAIGATQQPRPLDNPILWGNYTVAYTSVGRAPDQNNEPAGGRFRGAVGRSLFRTAGLYQSVLKPDIATNKVEFKLFGFLPGHVGLRGRVMPVGEAGDTVKVLFEPPVLTVADRVHLRIGGFSSVTLSTTYLDERVRIGKGSRGSLFVFKRDPAADAAGMDQIGLQRTSAAAAAVFGAFFLSLFAAGAALWACGNPGFKAAAMLVWLLGAAIGGVVRQGGLVWSRDERKIAEEAKVAMDRWDKERQQEQQKEPGQSGGAGGAAAPAAA